MNFIASILLLCYLICHFDIVYSVSWIPDVINFGIYTSRLQNQTWMSSIDISSNGLIYAPDGGNFRILLSANTSDYLSYLGITSCIPAGSSYADFAQIIQEMSFIKKHILDASVKHPSDLLSQSVIQFCTKHNMFVPLDSIFSSDTKKYSKSSGNCSSVLMLIDK